MGKTSGLGDNLYVAGVDCSGDINSLSDVGGGPALLDFTAINKSAMERQGGQLTGHLAALAYFNPTGAHPQLSSMPTADVQVSYFCGTALGNAAACITSKQIGYDGTRGDDGDFKFSVETQSNGYGLEWCTQMTAGVRTDSTATNGTSVDFGTGSTAFGLQAYLHVFSFTGTSATIKLQESSDNGAGDAFADVTGGSFGAQTAAGAVRIATSSSQTVERYLRVVTSGTFSSVAFAVAVHRNKVSTVF